MTWEIYEGDAKVKATGERITVIEIERDQGLVNVVYGRVTRSGTGRLPPQRRDRLSLDDIEFYGKDHG